MAAIDLGDLARRAAELGGEEAIASVSVRRELLVRCGPDGTLAPPRRTDDVVVRLLVRDGAGRIGVARCNGATNTDALLELAEAAHDQAAASHTDLAPLPYVAPGPVHGGFDSGSAALDPVAAVRVAREAAQSIAYEPGLARAATLRAEVVESAVAASGGDAVFDARTGARLDATAVDVDGLLAGAAQGSSRAVGDLQSWLIGDRATPQPIDVERVGQRALPSDLPVVLATEALAPLLEALARVACTGHAHATGTSPFTGRYGAPVAPAGVTLVDAPQHPRTLARSIDVEGVPAREVRLIDDGYLADLVHDTDSATEAGGISTGHAADLGGGADCALPRNLVLDGGGAVDLDDLLRPTDQAVVIGAIVGVRTHGPGSTRFTATGRVAYATSRGEPTKRLGDVALAGDLLDVLTNIDGLTVATDLLATMAREPEHTLATHCPAVLTSGITVVVS
ncbi:MAG: metallopeptidase TldD-related protein [Solirubrobacteraceae bacterium]|nr:metallopeptidase TldD-related protein [Patulibacter sp.]